VTATADWSEATILDATDKIMGFRGRTPKKLGMDWGGGRIPAISARNVRMGRIDLTEDFYLGSEKLYRRWMTHGDLEPGDTLITTEAPLGNVAAVPDDRHYILSQRTVLLRPNPTLFDKLFFTQTLQSPSFQRLLIENATGSTALGIQRKRLELLKIPMPRLTEQRQIAHVLADADDLIATLERLIVKEQAIKQGLMQQLLTGRTRLPGFEAPWKTVRLLELVSIRNGQVDPRRPEFRDLPLIAPDHVEAATGRLLNVETAKAQAAISGKYFAAPGDIIYSKIRPYLRKAVRVDFPALCSADMYPIASRMSVDGAFVLHTLLSERFTDFVIGVSTRSGIPKVNRAELAEYALTVPDSLEQRAISAVLDQADAQIIALEKLIAKKKAVKQGTMQQLLTGRTRLPVEAAP